MNLSPVGRVAGRAVRGLLASTLFAALLTVLPFSHLAARAQVSVLTQHNDNSRTGANLGETALTTASVNSAQFGKVFTRTVDGEIYAQALYVPNVAVPGQGTHNVIYVATMNNSVYAFDADAPNAATPLWTKNYGPPVPASDVQCCCTDISVKIGILGTPVIDPATQTLYFVHRTKKSDNTYHQYLHGIDLAQGGEKFNGPVEIAGSYGAHTFDPRIHNQRPGLLLLNGVIYIAWASHNDCGDYHGWVMGYDAANLTTQKAIYDATSQSSGSDGKGGIWQAGQGLTADSDGNIYAMTGNGAFNANTGGANLGCSFIKFRPNLTVADWFTPFNVDNLNGADADLGASGVLGLPGTNYLVGGGKEGKIYLLDRGGMGHFHAGSDNQIVQSFDACNGHIHGSPIYYNSPVNGPSIYVWSEQDNLKVFKFTGSSFQTTPLAYSATTVPGGMPGAMLSISANGSAAGSAIVWAAHPLNANANNNVVEGILRAYDASTVVLDGNGVPRLKELWNSKQNAGRDNLGNFGKFCPPTIANGKVYMATFGAVGSPLGSGQLVVYGPITPTAPDAPASLSASAGDGQVSLAWTSVGNATSYNVKRSATATGAYTTIATGVVNPAYTDTGLTNRKTYYYVVSAVNGIGESPNSNQASATPDTGIPIGLGPVADAYVRSGIYGDQNFGADPQLVVKLSPPDFTRNTFLKFDLSSVRGKILGATLRLYGAREGANTSASDSAYGVNDTAWSETGITWNNQPALGAKLSTITVTPTAKYYEWDVTAFVRAQKATGKTQATLAVTMDSLPPDGFRDNFNSREAGTNAPQLVVVVAKPGPPNYPNGFADVSDLTFNGSARQNGTKLELTDGVNWEAGSVFYNTPVSLASFRTAFDFQLTNPDADGMTFTIQGVGPTALGSAGGGLGYGPDPGGGPTTNISASAAIKFDLYNNIGEGVNSTGLFTNGAAPGLPSVDLNGSGIDLHSGHVLNVGVTYNGATLRVTITDNTTGATATQAYTVNLPQLIGAPTGYVGFTGGTGGLAVIQDILSWTFGPYAVKQKGPVIQINPTQQ